MNSINVVCDFAAAMDRVDNDRELYFELVDMFFADYEKSLRALEASIQEGELRSVEEGAHAMKSALGNLGAMTSHQAACSLETAARSADLPETLTQHLDALREQIELFKHAVESRRE